MKLRFVEVPAPTDEALQAVLHKIVTRTMKLLTRRGVWVEEQGQTNMTDNDGDSEEARALRPLQAAACTYRIAFGPRAGHKVLTLQCALPRDADFKQNLCADISGFSLHAAVRCRADDRQALEQLYRYVTVSVPPTHLSIQPILQLRTLRPLRWRAWRGDQGSGTAGAVFGAGAGLPGVWPEGQGVGPGQWGVTAGLAELVARRTCAGCKRVGHAMLPGMGGCAALAYTPPQAAALAPPARHCAISRSHLGRTAARWRALTWP